MGVLKPNQHLSLLNFSLLNFSLLNFSLLNFSLLKLSLLKLSLSLILVLPVISGGGSIFVLAVGGRIGGGGCVGHFNVFIKGGIWRRYHSVFIR